MKQFLLKSIMLLCMLMVGMGAWATEVTWNAASGALGSTIKSVNGTASGTIKSGNFSWSYQRTLKNLASGKSDYIAMSGNYLQIGSSNSGENVTFSTSEIPGTINSITIDCGSAGHTLSVSVNGTPYSLSPSTVPAWTNSSGGTITASGSQSGIINISYNVGSKKNPLYIKSITVNYTYDPNQATLSSISVKTPPTKVSYVEGECFDPAGLVITKNMSDGTKEDVTYNETTRGAFTFNPSISNELVNQNQVAITYQGKTVNQSITVSPFVVTAGTYNIKLNNDIYGVSTGNNATQQSVVKKGVTVVSGCIETAQTKTFYDATHIRYYVGSYLKLTAPTGYVITSVVFSEPDLDSEKKWDTTDGTEIASNVGTYSSKTWTGSATQVDLSFAKQCRVASIRVTYAPTPDFVVTTADTEFYSLYLDHAVTVPSNVSAYTGSLEGSTLTLSPVVEGTIPANTGIVFKTSEAGNATFVAAADVALIANNDIHGVTVDTPVANIEAGDGNVVLVLGIVNGNVCFAKPNSATLGANKAYIIAPEASSGANVRMVINEATAIKSVDASTTNSVRYNLAGQRVNANAKGIVIVNGKKMLNK